MATSSSPQPLAVGERNSTYASILDNKQSGQVQAKIELKQVEFIHGEATIKFSMEEVQQYAKEEGLHQALVIKFSQDQYDMQDIRKMLPKQFGTQGRCLVGWLARRHVLIRFDRHDDYVLAAAKSVNYLAVNGQELQMRIFPWTITFSPKEETSKAFVWISFPNLPPMLFAKQSLLSIASAAGKPLAIDKATQEKSRPSTARVKVELDLLGKLPQSLRIKLVDEKSGKVIEHLQKFVYDNLPLYCTCCKRQGHDVNTCRSISTKNRDSGLNGDVEQNDDLTAEKFQGDLRQLLNEKRQLHAAGSDGAVVFVNATALHEDADRNSFQAAEDTSQLLYIERDTTDGRKHVSGPSMMQSAFLFSKCAATGPQVSADDRGNPQTAMLNHAIVEQMDTTSTDKTKIVQTLGLDKSVNKGVTGRVDATFHAREVQKGDDTNNNIEAWNMVPARESPNSKQLPPTEKKVGQDASKIMSISNYFEALQVMEDGVPVAANAIERDEQRMVKQVGHLEEGPTMKKDITLDAQNNEIHDELSRVIEKPAGMKTLKVGNIDLVRDMGQWGRPLKIIDKDAAHVGILCRHIEQKKGEDMECNVKIIKGSCTNELVGQKTISESTNAGNGMQHVTDKDVGPKGSVIVAGSTNRDDFFDKKMGQTAMLLNSSLEKQPFATLNTSVFEIPSQSGDLDGESEGAIGQLTLSTGNNDEFIQAKVINSKLWLQQCDEDGEDDNDIINSNVRETKTKSNLWIQQREYDDEEELGVDFVDDSSDYGEKCSGDEEMAHVLSRIPKEGSHALIKANSMLNATAPDFIPSSRRLMHGPSTSSTIKNAVVATTNVESACVATDNFQDAPQLVNMGREIFAQGEEDELLQESRAKASRKGDLSPRHSGKGKNNHTRKSSWDDKASEFLNVRRPPMRNAKQKQIVPTTSTRSNRSKKK